MYGIAIVRLLSFLFLDDFEGKANMSVTVKSCSTVRLSKISPKSQPPQFLELSYLFILIYLFLYLLFPSGLLAQFNAVHHKDENVVCLATDSRNEYLLSGRS